MGKERKRKKGDILREFAGTGIPAAKPRSGSERGTHGGDRGPAVETGSGSPGGTTAPAASVEASEARRVLEDIGKLSHHSDRFKQLEKYLWENVAALVPAVMSFTDWSQTLQRLRESNNNADAKTGNATEDPLGAIRRFLDGEAA